MSPNCRNIIGNLAASYNQLIMPFRRRFIKRRRYGFKRRFGNRFIRRTRRAMSRRRARPEIKYIINDSNQDVASSGTYLTRLTPATISQGTTVGTRIGSKVKYLRVTTMFTLACEYSAAQANRDLDTLARVALLTPRVDLTTFVNYLAGVDLFDFFDHNFATIHMDELVPLQNIVGTANVLTGQGATSGLTNIRKFYKSIMFPRNVNFPPTFNTTDEPEDQIFLWVRNYYIAVQPLARPTISVNWGSKTSFIDL